MRSNPTQSVAHAEGARTADTAMSEALSTTMALGPNSSPPGGAGDRFFCGSTG